MEPSSYFLHGLWLLLSWGIMSSQCLNNNNVESRHRAECLMWSKLENKTLPLQNQGHAKCITNKQCTGFTCAGVYQNKDLEFGMRVLPCRETPGVEIYGHAPQFHAKNFSHVFTHKSKYVVPGSLLNTSMLPGMQHPLGKLVVGQLEVHLERNLQNKTLILGLTAMACINQTCVFRRPVFNHTEIPVPECPNKMGVSVDSYCNIHDIYSCGENQMCAQDSEGSSDGTCQCQPGFALYEKRCVSQEQNEKLSHRRPKSANDPQSQPHKSSSSSSGGSSGAAIAAGIISVLVIIALAFGVAAFVVMRTRFAPRLRARITRKPYEDIIIGDRSTTQTDSA